DSPLRQPGEAARRPTAAPAAEGITPARATREQPAPRPPPRASRPTPPAPEVERERSTPTAVARAVAEPSRKTTPAEVETTRTGRSRGRLDVVKGGGDGRTKPAA